MEDNKKEGITNEKENSNQNFSIAGKIDLTKENIEPIDPGSNNVEAASEYYSEQPTIPTEKIDLTSEDIEPVTSEEASIPTIPAGNAYNQGSGVTQVHIEEPQKKKLPKKTVAIIAGIIVLVALVIALVFYFVNRPKVLFFNSVNTTYNDIFEELSDNKSEIKEFKNKVIENSASATINLQTTNPELRETANKLNNLKLNMITDVDFKNKTFIYNLDLQSSNTSLINSYFYGKEKNMYIELKNLYSKLIKVDISENYDEVFSDKVDEDAKYLFETLKDTYLNELSDKDFSKSKEEIDVNGKKVKATKVSLNLNESRIKEINDAAADKLANDQKFVKAMAKFSGVSESEAKTALKDITKSSTDGTLVIDVCLDKKEPIKYDINIKDNTSNANISMTDYDEYFDLTLKVDEEILLSLTNEKDKTFINLGSATLEITEISDNNYDIIIKSGTTEITGTFTSTEKEISEKETRQNYNLTLNFDTATKLTINCDNTSKVLDKLTIPDVSNSVNVETLTDEDLEIIIENLMKNPEFTKVFGASLADTTNDQTIGEAGSTL